MGKSQRMASFLRKLVSQNKQRHVSGSYDLDLTYLTDQIICMGLPATGKPNGIEPLLLTCAAATAALQLTAGGSIPLR